MKIALMLMVAMTAGMVGCDLTTTPDKTQKISDGLAYFRDDRTGLCFASIQSMSGGYAITSITNVPCDHAPPDSREPQHGK